MSAAPRSVVVHAHFYQPPREDPWLDEVPAEPSAAPHHDWNQRIERECYRAVTAARIPAADGRIAHIANTLRDVSFDAGPTLLAWLEEAAPDTYRAFIEGDRDSAAAHDGHGNAIAAPFHHAILPLSTRRDKLTEVRWGCADFRRRFGRAPEGFWLPETAVDDETLDVLAEIGIKFTILAPHQVATPPPHGLPGRYRTKTGRTIAVFVYDGPISHDVAFGPLVRDATAWAAAASGPDGGRLVTIATDGETFGHHHRFGEMALAAFLAHAAAAATLRVENCAAFLARHPAEHDVVLRAPSSWSCIHGVERWRSACGCRMHPERDTQQRWRAPLRAALEWLAGEIHARFEAEGAPLFGDVWAARDAYGDVISRARLLDDLLAQLPGPQGPSARQRAAELLEMERHTLGMFTSCGWFFDDVAGIETREILRYAARAIELAGADQPRLQAGLRERLAQAPGNEIDLATACDVYDRFARPAFPAPVRVAAGFMAARAAKADAWGVLPRAYQAQELEGSVAVRHERTGRTDVFAVRIERPRPGQLVATVRPVAGAGTWDLALADLPEQARGAVTAELMRDVMDLWFSEDESAALCRGTPLLDVATSALLRAVTALADDDSAIASAQVLDILDLFTLLDTAVPFDAQTVFYRIRASLDPTRAAALAPVARRLGFS